MIEIQRRRMTGRHEMRLGEKTRVMTKRQSNRAETTSWGGKVPACWRWGQVMIAVVSALRSPRESLIDPRHPR